ncbi:SDR family oxidoreductase [Haloarchaeobius iranensis]|uniref:3-oxoacyl-[acyl-carrier protein] reductase n=1 Tax=Haloarchaeobius iranensis TaxID=996166 RepID=A0A1G9VAN9_9EURY|nr:SDR family oxidoreductase [Haloarchaeobius iranensis]SDM69153.1 3-oxoacyl-[acyl-carrier protein] reductase [Haloarchaeobius iranensis]
MDLHLDGDAALVTASSAGLGNASATALAREGANVTICGRDPDRLADAEAEFEGLAGDVLALEADITDPKDIAALVEATVEEFGGLDHLVTSAGGPRSGPFLDMTDQDFYEAYDLLVMSAVWTLKEAHPHLAADDGGTWTAITSTSVQEAIDGLVLSNGVRRAVVGVAKTVAREWAPDVRANVVLPAAHETSRIEELVEQSLERGEYSSYEAGLVDWADGIPMGRIGDPDELGDVVAFLASDRASFVNGASVPVDGGRLRS